MPEVHGTRGPESQALGVGDEPTGRDANKPGEEVEEEEGAWPHLLGTVILWRKDCLPFTKNVSGTCSDSVEVFHLREDTQVTNLISYEHYPFEGRGVVGGGGGCFKPMFIKMLAFCSAL